MKTAVATFLFFCGVHAFGAPTRVPWITSAIQGNPEPPKAFVEERVLPKLTFSEALELAVVPGTNRLLVVERRGRISTFPLESSVESFDEVIDLRAVQPRLENAYGVVLHPNFRETRHLFVCYAMRAGQSDGTRVSRFKLTSLDPLRADPASEEIIVTWLSGGHNGGSLQFGPDGYLYISTGDGGPAAPPDPAKTGQDVSDFTAAVLRIDIDQRERGKNYRVPPDNPWAGLTGDGVQGTVVGGQGTGDRSQGTGDGGQGKGGGGKGTAGMTPEAAKPAGIQTMGATRPELWAYGLRNPWKISFDRKGNLWCGDVGWEMWEMVHLVTRGGNYGWSAYEGSQPVKPHLANLLSPITRPIAAHPHSEAASITGGFVYYGKRLPELMGAYVYGDYVTGKIWALWYNDGQITRHEEIADTPHAIVTFGQSDDGELYYLHYAGSATTLHQLARNPQAVQPSQFPRVLSATGLFADVARLQPAAGVYPFAIASALWEDGATATRFIALRGTSTVASIVKPGTEQRARVEYVAKWPKDAVLARTITLGDLALNPADKSKPIETQILHYDGENWNAYDYRWNEAGSDADLVPAEGVEVTLRVAADRNAMSRSRDYTWRFQSRAECLRCHNARTTGALAFTPAQLRATGKSQVQALIEKQIITESFLEQGRIGRDSGGENAAARSWLQTNCAHCHTPHAGGSVSVFLNHELLTSQMNIVDVAPSQGGFGIKDPKLVAPGDPWNSVLTVRMAKSGSGHMPLIGARQVDVAGLKVIEDWIARMPAPKAAANPRSVATWDAAMIERELGSVGGAMRLRRAIDDGKINAALRERAYNVAWSSPDATVRDIFERFKPDELRERTLGANIDIASLLRLNGDPVEGAKMMSAEGKLASCLACHLVQGQGRLFGPDLTHIGARQDSAQILESLVAPSKSVSPLFQTTVFELRDGTSQAGFVRGRGLKEVVLAIPGGQTVKIKHGDVVAEKTLVNSLMPEGLLQGLTPHEAANLVAYLASLK